MTGPAVPFRENCGICTNICRMTIGEKRHKTLRYLSKIRKNRNTHDMGFKMYCSFGNGYRLTKDTTYPLAELNMHYFNSANE